MMRAMASILHNRAASRRLRRAAPAAALLGGLAAALALPASALDRSKAPTIVIALDGSAVPSGIVGADGAEGTIWFTSASRSAVGEVDVASRSVSYMALGHGAKPRNLTRCGNGKLYVLDPALNVIHEVTPATEQVTRHPMPSGVTADLTGAVCTAANILLFTGYNGWLGRLDTATGQISLVEAIGGRGPAQITMSPSGSVWFAAYASNQVVRVDPQTLKQDAFVMPSGVEGPKGIAVDASGRVWVSAFRSARIARFDPRRRSWDAWPTGEGSRPHSIALESSGDVLVTDVGKDRLMRFDPKTGTATVAAQLSDRGQARAMTRVGEQFWMAEAAADRLVAVDLSPGPSN